MQPDGMRGAVRTMHLPHPLDTTFSITRRPARGDRSAANKARLQARVQLLYDVSIERAAFYVEGERRPAHTLTRRSRNRTATS